MNEQPETTPPPDLRPVAVDIPPWWTPEEALAVYQLITDLRDAIWLIYGFQIMDELCHQRTNPGPDTIGDPPDLPAQKSARELERTMRPGVRQFPRHRPKEISGFEVNGVYAEDEIEKSRAEHKVKRCEARALGLPDPMKEHKAPDGPNTKPTRFHRGDTLRLTQAITEATFVIAASSHIGSSTITILHEAKNAVARVPRTWLDLPVEPASPVNGVLARRAKQPHRWVIGTQVKLTQAIAHASLKTLGSPSSGRQTIRVYDPATQEQVRLPIAWLWLSRKGKSPSLSPPVAPAEEEDRRLADYHARRALRRAVSK